MALSHRVLALPASALHEVCGLTRAQGLDVSVTHPSLLAATAQALPRFEF